MVEPDSDASVPPQGAFTGRETFRGRLRRGFSAAACGSWREIFLCDIDFADWPLGERALIGDLTHWVLAGGRLTLFASDYDVIRNQAPLFVRWRRQWSHRVECRAFTDLEKSDVPSFFWSRTWTLRRLDVLRCSGISGTDAAMRTVLATSIRDLRGRSEVSFPADILGL